MRKAFLDLDVDKDSVISAEDIMRYFSDQDGMMFDYFDLVKVLTDIDSKQQGSLNYNDFTRWMGGVIHKSEGFYFRHDSVKNPGFDQRADRRALKEKAANQGKMTT